MGADTRISWTNKTWNPVTGCSKVSEGCDFCYAETLSLRRGWSSKPWTLDNAAENVRVRPERLREPFRWKDPVMVFVNSMSDLFHERVPDDYIAAVFATMAATPQHTYQVLTKRPGRMASLTRSDAFRVQATLVAARLGATAVRWPIPNVWLGTSVETQKWAAVRVPQLLRTDAEIRFLSCEPLLRPLDLRRWLPGYFDSCDRCYDAGCSGDGLSCSCACHRAIDWVIVGGESGRHLKGKDDPRWMKMEWARDLRDQCVEAGVAFFMKQDSGPVTEQRPWVVEPDGSRWEWHQYPGDLRAPVLRS